MRAIEGWFLEDEAALLFHTAERAVQELPGAAFVEVGSYCGRSTVVLGAVARASGTATRVYAIDPHEGELSIPSASPALHSTTSARFQENVAAAGLRDVVRPIRRRSY